MEILSSESKSCRFAASSLAFSTLQVLLVLALLGLAAEARLIEETKLSHEEAKPIELSR